MRGLECWIAIQSPPTSPYHHIRTPILARWLAGPFHQLPLLVPQLPLGYNIVLLPLRLQPIPMAF